MSEHMLETNASGDYNVPLSPQDAEILIKEHIGTMEQEAAAGHHFHVHGDHVHHYAHKHMDSTGALFVLLFIVGAQFGLYYWKKYYYKSFRDVTLLGLWIVPMLLSLSNSFHRMLFIWSLFSIATFCIIRLASEKRLLPSTPKRVYSWFFLVYKLCNFLAISGYLCILCFLFSLDFQIAATFNVDLFEIGMLLFFYGVYYGLLGRDCSEVCAERMASMIGYYSKDGMPARQLTENTCAICDQGIHGEKVFEKETGVYRLNCGHSYHEFCLRGWIMIGKKDTCAYCKEKVSIKELFKNPWETQSLLWGSLLDAFRYLMVWNPIIFGIAGVALRTLYPDIKS